MADNNEQPGVLPASPGDVPTPPFHHVTGIANLRDIGGYPIVHSGVHDGEARPRSVRRGVLFRSADPTLVTTAGEQTLSNLGVRTVFDLRSQPEIEKKGPEWAGQAALKGPWVDIPVEALSDGTSITPSDTEDQQRTSSDGDSNSKSATPIRRVWTPVFAQADYSPEKTALRFKGYAEKGSAGFVRAYADILASGGPAFGTILRWLARPDGAASLVHCTAGKDRTGMLVAVVLLLLGVDDAVVAREYALTDLGLGLLKPSYRKALLKHEVFGGKEEAVENMITTREEAMLGAIEMLDQKYGGVEGYVRDVVGLSGDEVRAVRERLGCEEEPML